MQHECHVVNVKKTKKGCKVCVKIKMFLRDSISLGYVLTVDVLNA